MYSLCLDDQGVNHFLKSFIDQRRDFLYPYSMSLDERYQIPATKEWDLPKYLKGHILAAVPDMPDATFREAVIFMIDHNDKGAFGCVFNHLSNSKLGDVLELDDIRTASCPLYIGGPVQQNFIYALYSGPDEIERSENAIGPVNGIYFEPRIDLVFDYIKAEKTLLPEFRCRFFAGYSGWGAEQLDFELQRSAWITMPFDINLLFADNRGYQTALRKKGGIYWIAAETGPLPSRN